MSFSASPQHHIYNSYVTADENFLYVTKNYSVELACQNALVPSSTNP